MVKFEGNIETAKLPKLDHFYFFERYRFDFFLTDLDSASKDHSFLFFYLSVWTEASAATTTTAPPSATTTTAPPSATTAKQGKQ